MSDDHGRFGWTVGSAICGLLVWLLVAWAAAAVGLHAMAVDVGAALCGLAVFATLVAARG